MTRGQATRVALAAAAAFLGLTAPSFAATADSIMESAKIDRMNQCGMKQICRFIARPTVCAPGRICRARSSARRCYHRYVCPR